MKNLKRINELKRLISECDKEISKLNKDLHTVHAFAADGLQVHINLMKSGYIKELSKENNNE
jgi:hypothetical protein